jgi:hypothetical protein
MQNTWDLPIRALDTTHCGCTRVDPYLPARAATTITSSTNPCSSPLRTGHVGQARGECNGASNRPLNPGIVSTGMILSACVAFCAVIIQLCLQERTAKVCG